MRSGRGSRTHICEPRRRPSPAFTNPPPPVLYSSSCTHRRSSPRLPCALAVASSSPSRT
uniref:Uncharacterized protein n=1 Tax=Zea mays TaxID=4577 RepID=B6SLY9_MAIZE|nr:hypothetical protein [Zea mays]